MSASAEVIASFIRTLWLSRKSLDRQRFERLQHRAIMRWLARDVPRVSFYAGSALSLDQLPVVDKAMQMARFEQFNQFGLTAQEIRSTLAQGSFQIDGHTVGASTGTSGNRGVFVVSRQESNAWLGSILAKTIPDMLLKRPRVAILLPQNTGLYDNAARSRVLDLAFFNLTTAPHQLRGELEGFAPTVVVAPPKVLRYLAEEKSSIRPQRIFSAAETLDPVDRSPVEAFFGLRLEQIYMATEGLFAVTCRHGNLHLAEDSVHFEFEPVGKGLVSPLVSTFRRNVQIMARYRMNDLLRLSPQSCPCGSPLRHVTEIVGRQDDIFRLASPTGPVMVTPDVLRNAVLNADPRITDFRIVQTATDCIEVSLAPDLPEEAASAALRSLQALLEGRGAKVNVVLLQRLLELETGRKLRRVECRLVDAQVSR
ncbi:F390 synthetase-related protein [Breoghania sp.]|uniref:F390 synthetase-related protein n=1 Tax=Breoghania sp. TaxID=2065378 RepID=UPI002AABCD92|nr:F390 synthetase-related protein [Breoghania sp.]